MMDLHNHTNWSNDAVHEPEEIVENAIRNGIKTIGITDHHRSILEGWTNHDNLRRYIDKLNELKEKYKDRIKVLAGLEINVNFHDGEEEGLPCDMFDSLDYVLLEHVDGGELFGYKPVSDYCLHFSDLPRFRERIHCAAGLAHTDLLGRSRIYKGEHGLEYGMDNVIKMMQDNNLFWEINTSYHDDYLYNTQTRDTELKKRMLFDKLKHSCIKVSAGSDTHYLDCYDIESLTKAKRLASSIGASPF